MKLLWLEQFDNNISPISYVNFRSQLNRRIYLIVSFDPPGQALIHRIMSIILNIQRIARMVYVFLDELCVQLATRERFNCGMCFSLDKYYINNRKSIIQVINIYL